MLSKSATRASLAVVIVATLLAAGGCSMIKRPDGSLRFLPRGHNADYQKSAEARPLDVPPDLDTPATDPTMQVPGSRAGGAVAAATGGPAFTLQDNAAGSWDRLGKALDHIDGVTVTQRSQLINSYEVQYKGNRILLRVSPDGAASKIDAVGVDGTPLRTPEALDLLGQLRGRLS
ncbi:MAG: hypothetical protein JSS41_05885 [Proteobacteria bacterium]|nr:hypothetical protein [Pseudomonadota bacterium]